MRRALAAVLFGAACARMEPPPGGPPDFAAPRLAGVTPDSIRSLPGFDEDVEFRFNEVISEGSQPNFGLGTGDLERLVLVSPSAPEDVPAVQWKRDRITVKPKGGWRPNTVYRVELLTGVRDLRNNAWRGSVVVTFTTGTELPADTLRGRVVDWSTTRPAARALVVATLLPDSLEYRGTADSTGRFLLQPLPRGEYLVSGVVDQNRNARLDLRESFDTLRVTTGRDSAVGELWAFRHDSTAPRLQTVTVQDSVTIVAAFTQSLDPFQRLEPDSVRLLALPDSLPQPVRSLLPKVAHDSAYAARPRPDSTRADSTRADSARADSARVDTVRRQPARRVAGARLETPAGRPDPGDLAPLTTKPALFDQLYLRVDSALAPGGRYFVELHGVRTVSGVSGTTALAFIVPSRPTPPAGDSARAARDTTRPPADTTRRPPPPSPPTAAMTDPRRGLPSVTRLLEEPAVRALLAAVSRPVVVGAVRQALAAARASGGAPPADWGAEIRERVAQGTARSLDRVLNATGIVLHTNLGRAPLAPAALEAIRAVAEGYSTLEYDLHTGARGSRADHCAPLLAELSGAEDALVVNNAAAALVLALNALSAGREVLISRGELIEIGGSFRIPDILEKSGAILREVGTTNRTRLADYERGFTDRTGAILTVHRSNFEQRGFVETPEPRDLASLAHGRRVPYLYDLGSGLLADLSPWGLTGEPRVSDGVASGADLVLFSGDKLLGGPQAGCLAGLREAVRVCRANPFARAARADKLTLAALEATLALYRDPARARREIPVLRMLTPPRAELERRAARLAAQCPAWCRAAVVPGASAVGGGAFPGVDLPTALVAIAPGDLGAEGLGLRLRLGTPPLITRVSEGKILLDPRTLPDEADATVIRLLAEAGE